MSIFDEPGISFWKELRQEIARGPSNMFLFTFMAVVIPVTVIAMRPFPNAPLANVLMGLGVFLFIGFYVKLTIVANRRDQRAAAARERE